MLNRALFILFVAFFSATKIGKEGNYVGEIFAALLKYFGDKEQRFVSRFDE